ncbi:hypothetical protein KBI52_14960, partial [Microvirga sp. HBU67558]|uniref:hypothetical protein n=1 Tax=Microvirga sp. HBU67558 TaxID=2824562 RepID=UPI001B37F3C8
ATRATLDHPEGSQRKLRACRCWLFDSAQINSPSSDPPPVMAGLVPAIPIGKAPHLKQSGSPAQGR